MSTAASGCSRERLGVIIPAFNAAATIGAVVNDCLRYVDNVVVVDDGSTDETAWAAQSAGATVIRHDKNRGKGQALKTGFAFALSSGWSGALTLDADLQHAAHDLPKFLKAHGRDPDALLLGRRKFSKMPAGSRFVRTLGTLFLSFSARQVINDTQCGFRLYPASLLSRVRLWYERFELESEILLVAGRLGIPIRSVPIATVYYQGERRQKHVQPIDTWKIIFLFYESLKPAWLRTRCT